MEIVHVFKNAKSRLWLLTKVIYWKALSFSDFSTPNKIC